MGESILDVEADVVDDDVVVDTAATPRPSPWWRRVGLCVVAGSVLVALVARLDTAAASFETYDERPWLYDSARFWDNLASGDLDGASAEPDGEVGTMPGITTMWVGTAARGVWTVGVDLGWWSGEDPPSYGGGDTWYLTRSGLNVAQVAMALVTSLLIGLVVALLLRWAGALAAAIAGLLLATEPFIVAHGTVLHTDELMALFGLASVIAVALLLGLPQPTPLAGKRSTAILAGVLFAGCFLTKVTGLMLLPVFAVLAGWAILRTKQPRPTLVAGAWAGVSCLVTMLLLYPALWAEPGEEIQAIWDAVMVGREGHIEYFFGDPTPTPGPAFYAVAMPFRSTPWLLVLGIVAAVLVWLRPRIRPYGAVLAVGIAVPFVMLSLAKQQHDRYGLLLPMFGAVLVGVVGAEVYRSLSADRVRFVRAVGLAAGAFVVVHSVVVAPWGIAYFNPLLGGSGQVRDVMNVGWGEGYEMAGKMVEELVDGNCDDVTVLGYTPFMAHYRCGEPPAFGEPADYVVAYIEESLVFPDLYNRNIRGRELLAERKIRGLPYIRIYGPLDEAAGLADR